MVHFLRSLRFTDLPKSSGYWAARLSGHKNCTTRRRQTFDYSDERTEFEYERDSMGALAGVLGPASHVRKFHQSRVPLN